MFVHNGSRVDHDLLLRLPLDGAVEDDGMTHPRSLTIRDHNRELQGASARDKVAQAYVEHDTAAPAFVPLSAEVSIG